MEEQKYIEFAKECFKDIIAAFVNSEEKENKLTDSFGRLFKSRIEREKVEKED